MAKSVRAVKAALRKDITALLRNIFSRSITTQSERAINTLLQLPQYKAAHRISVYLSMPGTEIQTRFLVLHALSNGKKVFVPYISSTEPMRMFALRNEVEYEGLKGNAWGIPSLSEEGLKSREECRDGDGLDMVVLPGVAFDRGLRRLGHGKGYYDKFLSDLERRFGREKMPFLVGLALSEQILSADAEVPTSETDWRVDMIVTGDGARFER